jgi:hypothetical protein
LFKEVGLLDHDEDAVDVGTVLGGRELQEGFSCVLFPVLAD